MEKAAAEARKIYEKDHPDAKGKELKYDPLKEMEEGMDGLFHHWPCLEQQRQTALILLVACLSRAYSVYK